MDMKLMISLVLLGLTCVECGVVPDARSVEDILHLKQEANDHTGYVWDYAENGPSTWGRHAERCDGDQQSPINIVTCETSSSSGDNLVSAHNYWDLFDGKYTVTNNGHALQMDLPKDTKYYLIKRGKKYVPVQVHIHFDSKTGKGSEHTLNSRKYFAEIHIVHKNAAYPNGTFMDNPDGLLVVGIFVDLIKGVKANDASELDFMLGSSKVQTPNNRNSFAMMLFSKVGAKLVNKDMKKKITPFPLAWLLPTVSRKHSTLSYVNYHGSLTTPPCSEIVDWIVITGKTLEINEDTAKAFNNVLNTEGKRMDGNNRPIQDLNGRDVYGVERSF